MAIFHFVYDMLSDLFSNGDWPGIVLGCILILVMLVLVGLMLWGLFVAADSWFLPRRQANGTITGRHYTPASTVPITTNVSNGQGGFTPSRPYRACPKAGASASSWKMAAPAAWV